MSPNPYLEKASALLESAIAAHLAQNLATRAAMRSPTIAKSLANEFAHGFHGKVEKGVKQNLKHVALGAAAPDVEIMHKTFHNLGRDLSGPIRSLSPREQLGLRMISEGRFRDLMHHGLHRNAKLQNIVNVVGKHTGVDVPHLEHLTKETAGKLGEVWQSKDHPLLSNFASQMSHGKVSPKAVVGGYSSRAPLLGSAASMAIDPASGALSTAKNLMATDAARSNKTAKKAIDYAEKKLIKEPVLHGFKAGGSNFSKGLKNKLKEFGVSPTSMSLKNTSSAISGAMKPAQTRQAPELL